MKFEDILKKVWFFDFEVYAHDWLLVAESYDTGEEVVFHNSESYKIRDWLDDNNPYLTGHNAKYFDQYILKGVLADFEPEDIFKLSSHLIKGGQGWQVNFGRDYIDLPPILDTIVDIVPKKGLKEIEGNLRMNIVETTIPFDMPTKWTEEEYQEVLFYCRHDVKALRPLFEARMQYFRTKFDLCMLTGIEPAKNMGLTNAKLVAKYLGAEYKEHNDERDYNIPDTVDTTDIPKDILDFFLQIKDDTISRDELFGNKELKIKPKSLKTNLFGVECKYAWGGQHGAKKRYFSETTKEKVIINCDFESLYPHLLSLPQYAYMSRNVLDDKKYGETLANRLNLKHLGMKKEQEPLKLVLNTTFGCLINKYNALYDPKMGRSTCITGQLLLTELMMKLSKLKDMLFIQSNTDGIMIEIPRSELPLYYDICEKFMKKCGINLEYDIIDKIQQRDVNNYVMLYTDKGKKKIKAKGGCFSASPDIKITDNANYDEESTDEDNEPYDLETMFSDNFKANSLSIVAEAVMKYLIFNTPVDETINNCDDIFRFQMINKCGGSYIKLIQESPDGDIELQRTNRIYAGKTKSGIIVKVKADGRRDSLPSCPDNPLIDNDNHCSIDDINKKWYIDLANQRISDFLGLGKHIMKGRQKLMKKDELIEVNKELTEKLEKSNEQNEKLMEKIKELMATDKTMPDTNVKKKEGEIMESNIHKKIVKFRELVRERKFVLDAELPKNLGGGEYYSIDQYYDAVQELSMEVGLDFSFEIVDLVRFDAELFKPANGSPQHVATIRAVATFTDVESGEHKTYNILGSGSDSIDKSIGGASTMAFRNWFKYNFTPKGADDTDDKVVEAPKSVETKPKAFIPETKKAELVTKTIENGQVEKQDDAKIKGIVENIMKIRTIKNDQTYGASTLQNLMSGTLTSPEIMQIQLTIEDRLEELGAK